MPMYEYECEKCGYVFEDLASPDAPCPPCPKCQEQTRKVMSKAAIRTEYASPIDRGVAPIRGYNPTGRKNVCPMAGGCGTGGCGSTVGNDD
ncbi:FmdB family zinc ribbon protein [Desulfovibrio ferrophilus]|uniref:Regulatory protein, FmdB family n=1 Tax=Desulfovibrio ferrophilus TaxID=241368 RepID=A0A2Z6AZF8_9BACT|nr:zinc ribbon domain-containing protein [Desulfovibrio ferrophilus]BBD08536.1 regulatory protein, FmdB family [Desulfovibrio ferrophilus]